MKPYFIFMILVYVHVHAWYTSIRSEKDLKTSDVYLALMVHPIFLYTTDDRRIHQTILSTQTKLVLIFLNY